MDFNFVVAHDTDLLKSQIYLCGHPTCIETNLCCCSQEMLCVTLAMQWPLLRDTGISFYIQIPRRFSNSVNQDYKLESHGKGNISLGVSMKNESLVPRGLVMLSWPDLDMHILNSSLWSCCQSRSVFVVIPVLWYTNVLFPCCNRSCDAKWSLFRYSSCSCMFTQDNIILCKINKSSFKSHSPGPGQAQAKPSMTALARPDPHSSRGPSKAGPKPRLSG